MFLHNLVSGNADSTAVNFVDDQLVASCLTYKQLWSLSDDIYAALKCQDLSENSGIGVLLETSIILPSVLIGIMQSGCFFIFLNPVEPVEFLMRSIHRASVKCLITERNVLEKIKSSFDGWVAVDLPIRQGRDNQLRLLWPKIKLHENRRPPDLPLAYAMQTSGTTGDFKLVLVPHCCIVPNILHLKKIFNIKSSDICFLASPLSFDPSIVDIFMGLSAGSILLVHDKLKRDIEKLTDILFGLFQVTYLQVTPSFFNRFPVDIVRRLILSESSRLRILAFGGEMCPPSSVLNHLRHPRNPTRLFNLYGITEVSCWATIHELTACDPLDKVPLGQPLMETELTLTSYGETNNEILIGSSTRICFVDGETVETAPKWRHTGDIGQLGPHGDLYIVGRENLLQIKRQGKRINLAQIDSAIISFDEIKTSSTVLCDDYWLVSFILPISQVEEEESFKQRVKDSLRRSLPNYSQPDLIVVEESLPTTPHGKVDRAKLTELAKTRIFSSVPFSCPASLIRTFIKEHLKIDCTVDMSCSFLSFGADSLKMVQLISLLEHSYSVSLPDALTILMNDSVENFLLYCSSVVRQFKDSSTSNNPLVLERVLSKGKSQLRNLKLRRIDWLNLHSCTLLTIGRSNMFNQHLNSCILNIGTCSKGYVKLKLEWKFDMGKCIDASPFVVFDDNSATVYIGSHSHRFVALNLFSGKKIWSVVLSDRIEASAVLSSCQKYVIVGCYDGSLNFLGRNSGELNWVFRAADAIKCSAVAYPGRNVVFIGSHDRTFYCLHYQAQVILWKRLLDGAIFSTPIIKPDTLGAIFVATLSSTVYALSTQTGDCLWIVKLSSPAFSSLVMNDDHLLVGCVDGKVFYLDVDTGSKMLTYSCGGHLFSTPTAARVGGKHLILLGSHDCYLHAIENGQILWKTKFNSALASSPFVVYGEVPVCIATETAGLTTLVDLNSGKKLLSYKWNGETFSSPVAQNGYLLQGCRDNFLYCLKMS